MSLDAGWNCLVIELCILILLPLIVLAVTIDKSFYFQLAHAAFLSRWLIGQTGSKPSLSMLDEAPVLKVLQGSWIVIMSISLTSLLLKRFSIASFIFPTLYWKILRVWPFP